MEPTGTCAETPLRASLRPKRLVRCWVATASLPAVGCVMVSSLMAVPFALLTGSKGLLAKREDGVVGEAEAARLREHFSQAASHEALPLGAGEGHRVGGDEGALAAAGFDQALSLQVAVGAGGGIGVDEELRGEFPHGPELIAGR